MIKYYSVVVYWREAGFEDEAWTGVKQEWFVSAHSEGQAKRRALAINDFTTRYYEEEEYDIEVYGCEVVGMLEEDDVQCVEDDWKRYQEWIKTKFVCADCGRLDFFPKENEIGKFCDNCWNIQEKMKSLG